ncbi:uncharacterized protein LOC135819802 [Sycon ciliatum]|uniref:uncharacterized protein LOC135819802 n=1 Tax=Sycon ciliatum TaxID=27933 RepID=UPI0031F676E0
MTRMANSKQPSNGHNYRPECDDMLPSVEQILNEKISLFERALNTAHGQQERRRVEEIRTSCEDRVDKFATALTKACETTSEKMIRQMDEKTKLLLAEKEREMEEDSRKKSEEFARRCLRARENLQTELEKEADREATRLKNKVDEATGKLRSDYTQDHSKRCSSLADSVRRDAAATLAADEAAVMRKHRQRMLDTIASTTQRYDFLLRDVERRSMDDHLHLSAQLLELQLSQSLGAAEMEMLEHTRQWCGRMGQPLQALGDAVPELGEVRQRLEARHHLRKYKLKGRKLDSQLLPAKVVQRHLRTNQCLLTTH